MKYYLAHIWINNLGYDTVVEIDDRFPVTENDIQYDIEDMAVENAENYASIFLTENSSEEDIDAYFQDAIEQSSYEEISKEEYDNIKEKYHI